MLPPLPHELTTDILKLATLSLVEQERHDSTITGQTNALLLSASLVSHTWRNIAQPLLLKHGLVDPSRALHFIGEHARAGLKDTLAGVRIGVSASRTMSDVDARAGGIGLRAILEELPALKALEFVGQRLRIQGFIVTPNREQFSVKIESMGADADEVQRLQSCPLLHPAEAALRLHCSLCGTCSSHYTSQ
ncbi:hypothetical protein RQP46_007972 [Phenoliferia psychrophenolica]